MDETTTPKNCPWVNIPSYTEPCTSHCALWLDGLCSFAWLGRWAQEQINEAERQELRRQRGYE
jgi:hypothetical protein